jgi:hypothetical protein
VLVYVAAYGTRTALETPAPSDAPGRDALLVDPS